MSPRRAHLAAALAALTGCATIFTGTVDPLKFDANVPGVMLSIDGRFVGTLPLELRQSRNFMGGQQFVAKFEAPGYETQEFRLQRQFNPAAILDVSSPVTSGGIDILTGSLMRFSPTDYYVLMRPLAAAPPPNAPAPAPAYPPEAPPPGVSPAHPPPTAPAAPPPDAVPPPAGSSDDRSLRLHQFAAANFRRIQSDVARGGGEHLTAAAALAGGGEAGAARRHEEAALQAAPALVAIRSPAEFARRFEAALAAAPSSPQRAASPSVARPSR